MATAQLRRVVQGVGNSVGVESGWPQVPRAVVVLGALTVAATVLAIFGDTVLAGRAGRLLAIAGLLGLVVVTPTFLARCLTWGRGVPADGHGPGANRPGRYR